MTPAAATLTASVGVAATALTAWSTTGTASASLRFALSLAFALLSAAATWSSAVQGDGGQCQVVILIAVQGDFLADQPLNVPEVSAFVVFIAEGNGNAFGTCPASPSDSVDIGLRDVGDFVIDDVAQVVYVDAACRDVGGHQNAKVSALKRFHGLFPLGLRLVAVNGFTAHPLFPEVLDQFVCAILGSGEDQCTAHVGCLQDIHQKVLFFCLTDEKHLLFNGFCSRASTFDFHREGVDQNRIRQLLDVLGHRGREEQGLSPWWEQFDHLSDVVNEPHV